MSIAIVLTGLSVVLFFIYFFYTGAKRSAYLIFILAFFPIMDSWVTPAAYGPLSLFHFLTYFSLIFFYKDFFNIPAKKTLYVILFLIFITLVTLSSLASEFPVNSLFAMLTIIPPFIYARLLICELKENPAFIKKIVQLLRIAGLIAIGFIVAQMIFGLKFTFYEVLNQNVMEGGKIRYPSFFPDSQFSGLFLAMCSFAFLVNFGNLKKPTVKNYILFGLMALATMIAGSRSGLLGLVAGLVFLVFFVGGNFRIITALFAVAGTIALLLFSDSLTVLQRFNNVDDSISFRASIWDGAYEIFKKNYVLGIGMSNYQNHVMLHSQDQYLVLDDNQIMFLSFPENGYLKILPEWGLPACFFFFAIILNPIIKLVYNLVKGYRVVIGFFFVAPVITWLLSFSTLYTLQDSRIVILLCTFLATVVVFPKDLKLNLKDDSNDQHI